MIIAILMMPRQLVTLNQKLKQPKSKLVNFKMQLTKLLQRLRNSKRARTESNKKPLLQNRLPKMLKLEKLNKSFLQVLRKISLHLPLRLNSSNHNC